MKNEVYIEESSWMNPLPQIEYLRELLNTIQMTNPMKSKIRKTIRIYQQLTYEGFSHPTRLSQWYANVKERDVVCQVCGTDENLQAHHIIYKSVCPLLQFSINNGITLCRNCHSDTHRMESVHRLILFPKGRHL